MGKRVVEERREPVTGDNCGCEECERVERELKIEALERALQHSRSLPPCTISLTLADLNVYEHIDGHPFGVVFNESFPFEHGLDDACFDLWGFGETEEEAVHQLLADTEQ